MCQFMSAIITRDGQVLQNCLTDSHEELIAHFDLHERKANGHGQNFIRIEFTPGRDKEDRPVYDDSTGYKLRVDENETPTWFDAEARGKAEKFLRGVIERMIVRDERKMLLGGVWILAKGAKVQTTRMCRIIAMSGAMVEYLNASNVGVMWESSKVGVMRGSSNVGEMRESSKVGVMWESSKVGEMRESSKVGEMRGSSNVGVMRGSSNVGEMWESSSIPDEERCVERSRKAKAAAAK